MRNQPLGRSWLLVFCLLLAVPWGCGGAGESDEVADADAGDFQRRPLIVLGVDGATWDLIDPMIARGELPNFRRLVETGLRGDLVSIPPLSSPPVWTTVATGRFARHHNVLDHVFPYVDGPKRRVSSRQRRVPALWNVASHHDRSVAVVGYYATHPVEEVHGAMVSDRAGRGVAGGIYPPALEEELAPVLEELQQADEIAALRRKYLPWPYDDTAIHRPEDPYHRATQVVIGRIAKHLVWEELVRRAALRLAPRQHDLLMVYLRMPDHASHATWLYFDPTSFPQPPDPFDEELLRDIIPTAYRDTDAYLGELLAAVGSEANVVVLSDHGFGPAIEDWHAGRKATDLRHLSGSHRPDGIFLAAGPDFQSGEIEGLSILDIAPTLLAALGLPVSEELPGRVAEEVFLPAFLKAVPPRQTPGYRMRWRTVEEPEVPAAATEIEDLKILESLGYVESGVSLAPADARELAEFWSISPRLSRNAIIGETLFHLTRGDQGAIEALIRLVEEHDPELLRALGRITRQRAETWQGSFDFTLVDAATREWFAACCASATGSG
ncbi:MAG: alkaline phosphatase family protein [Acidobacteriota bacterium]